MGSAPRSHRPCALVAALQGCVQNNCNSIIGKRPLSRIAGAPRRNKDFDPRLAETKHTLWKKSEPSLMPDADAEDLAEINAVLDGDEEAYARLVERHSVAIGRQMRNFSRDPLIQEELVQDVFVEAYLSLGKFRGDAPFRHWLARIATLIGYKHWKRRDKGKKEVSLSEAWDRVAAKPESRDPSAAADLLYDLLAMLRPEDRLILTLMYIEKCGQDEIAERMGGTRVMAAVKIYRAKQKLKKLGEKEPWKGRIEWILS